MWKVLDPVVKDMIHQQTIFISNQLN